MTDINKMLRDAEAAAPSREEIIQLNMEAEAAQDALEVILEKLKPAAVTRARVYGWVSVAEDLGTSPKMLHSWAKKIPGTDLSKLREAVKEAADG